MKTRFIYSCGRGSEQAGRSGFGTVTDAVARIAGIIQKNKILGAVCLALMFPASPGTHNYMGEEILMRGASGSFSKWASGGSAGLSAPWHGEVPNLNLRILYANMGTLENIAGMLGLEMIVMRASVYAPYAVLQDRAGGMINIHHSNLGRMTDPVNPQPPLVAAGRNFNPLIIVKMYSDGREKWVVNPGGHVAVPPEMRLGRKLIIEIPEDFTPKGQGKLIAVAEAADRGGRITGDRIDIGFIVVDGDKFDLIDMNILDIRWDSSCVYKYLHTEQRPSAIMNIYPSVGSIRVFSQNADL